MSNIIDDCSHSNELIDQREGNIVCSDCGLVLDCYFEVDVNHINRQECELISKRKQEFVYETLERLHIPQSIAFHIFKKINESSEKNQNEIFLSGIIYKTLIELNIPFTIKEISCVTGIKVKNINKKKIDKKIDVVIINTNEILERACSKLNLKFNDYTLIKEKIKKMNNGFNPSTIIAGNIYVYCKENNKKLSMKDISNVTGISCMSIKRFTNKIKC